MCHSNHTTLVHTHNLLVSYLILKKNQRLACMFVLGEYSLFPFEILTQKITPTRSIVYSGPPKRPIKTYLWVLTTYNQNDFIPSKIYFWL